MKIVTAALGVVISFVLIVVLTFVAVFSQQTCITPGVTITGTLPTGEVAGYGAEELKNAATIAEVASSRGLSRHAQKIGIMTAMGESSLKNVGYGDDIHGVTNPDGTLTCSLGLFQQQWCLGWGTKDQVLDPVYAAGAFFDRLIRVSGWEDMTATLAIHSVQRNADPQHYAKYDSAADEVLDAIGTGGGQTCPTGTAPGKDGWSKPANGPITSRYGMREGPFPNHTGLDLNGDGCYGPIWAAQDGTVSDVFIDGLHNQVVDVDHGGGIVTRYVHMYADGILVTKGQTVKSGQQIAKTGASGAAFGCHLHLEVLVDGTFVDPEAFLAERGITF